MQFVLITGGLGYIGSHTCAQLMGHGYEVILVDNFSNSKRDVLHRIERLAGKKPIFYEADILDEKALTTVFKQHKIASVIHFAGLKAVGESVKQPLQYFNVNIAGSLTLLKVMAVANVKRLIFSSSATVYGSPLAVPIAESHPLSATNPYGRSKLFIEEILRDLFISDATWDITILRYFNPVGAHESGLLGENPNGSPNNLMPLICQVASGVSDKLLIYGSDYDTPDGTGVRDFIHVTDLANGHVCALAAGGVTKALKTFNLGTGTGYSVLQVISTFEKVTGQTVPFEFSPRREGDIGTCYADASNAECAIGWKAIHLLPKMCEDAWRYYCFSNCV